MNKNQKELFALVSRLYDAKYSLLTAVFPTAITCLPLPFPWLLNQIDNNARKKHEYIG